MPSDPTAPRSSTKGSPSRSTESWSPRSPSTLSGLADANGNVVVVTAGLTTTTKTKTAKGAVKILRRGELVLSPDGDTWKIGGYDLLVDRTGKGLGLAGVTTTTVAPATTGTAAK